jgi:hypothetical protein
MQEYILLNNAVMATREKNKMLILKLKKFRDMNINLELTHLSSIFLSYDTQIKINLEDVKENNENTKKIENVE